MTSADWFWIGLLAGLAIAWITFRLARRARDTDNPGEPR